MENRQSSKKPQVEVNSDHEPSSIPSWKTYDGGGESKSVTDMTPAPGSLSSLCINTPLPKDPNSQMKEVERRVPSTSPSSQGSVDVGRDPSPTPHFTSQTGYHEPRLGGAAYPKGKSDPPDGSDHENVIAVVAGFQLKKRACTPQRPHCFLCVEQEACIYPQGTRLTTPTTDLRFPQSHVVYTVEAFSESDKPQPMRGVVRPFY